MRFIIPSIAEVTRYTRYCASGESNFVDLGSSSLLKIRSISRVIRPLPHLDRLRAAHILRFRTTTLSPAATTVKSGRIAPQSKLAASSTRRQKDKNCTQCLSLHDSFVRARVSQTDPRHLDPLPYGSTVPTGRRKGTEKNQIGKTMTAPSSLRESLHSPGCIPPGGTSARIGRTATQNALCSSRIGCKIEEDEEKAEAEGWEKLNLDRVMYHGLNTCEDRHVPFLPKTILSFTFTSPLMDIEFV
ncbi:hypothetical protein Naga_100549g3 [Nannochloropsis gaditana]|uniref:Uncharacterized protein n=1 Tax=Nannochloropsis gaditana TaxID=72520 RepID=W7TK39_9STRA|nr:hypothetical protein Naga_100549g3 [Nannochloropsis gaditana]